MDSGFYKKDIRPEFLEKTDEQDRAANAASAQLADAEQGATTGGSANIADLESARKNEESAGGFYSKATSQDDKKAKGGGKVRSRGKFKKRGPMVTILLLLCGAGGLMGGAQLMQPFSLVEQLRETFNSMQTSANARSNVFFKMQMDSGRIKNPIKGKIFGADTFKITTKQRAKLAAQGITVDDDFGGSGIRVLKFDDGTGSLRVVAADDASIGKLDGVLSRMRTSGTDIDAATGLKYNAESISYKNLYESNADFFHGYNKGSMTWRGAVANWFGKITAKFLGSNKITRNMFKNFQEEVKARGDGNTRAVAIEKMKAGTDEIDAGGASVRETHDESDTDASEKDAVKTVANDASSETDNGKIKRTDMADAGKAKSKVQQIASGFAGKVNKVANLTCLALNVVGGISLLVSASEAQQIIRLISAYFESVDKVKAGYGDDSPIHDLTTALNSDMSLEYSKLVSSGKVVKDENTSEAEIVATVKTEKTQSRGTAMTSSGIAALYGGGAVDPNDPSVESFNFTKSIEAILGGIGTSMTAFQGCAIAKITASIISATVDALTIAGCIAGLVGAAFTFGMTASACTKFVVDIGKSIAISIGAGILVAGLVSIITPLFSERLTRDLIGNLGGEDLGNALTSGANMYLGNGHRANGGSLSSEKKYVAFAKAQQETIAENARYERLEKSPFDITSKNTFLGSIISKLMLFSTANSFTRLISSAGSVVSTSIISLTPTGSAYEIADDLMPIDEYEKYCPYLASIGAVGDMYCNPYTITDISTIDEDPADLIDKKLSEHFLGELGSDGNVQIKDDSDLAKYILFCNNRQSAFGIADQNISNQVSTWGQVNTGSGTFNNIANSAIGALPVIGDVIDVGSNKQLRDNAGYISGESCVAGNTVSQEKSPNWETAKYYQRFIEDQALAESMGLIEKSAVAIYLDDYYEKNPLDNSYEGILARYSGLEKEDVVALLDFVDYSTYVANYDPSTRFGYVNTEATESDPIVFEDNHIAASIDGVVDHGVIYFDLRNKNYAI